MGGVLYRHSKRARRVPGGATSKSVLWLSQPCVRRLVVGCGDASILGITEVTTEYGVLSQYSERAILWCYVLIEAVIPLH